MQLSDLLVVAAHEPALGEIGGKNSVLAVAENARALIISALSARAPKTTLIVATPTCLLYTSPSPRDRQKSRMPSSA